jgi:putative endonuclease
MSYYVYLLIAKNPGVRKSYVGYTNNLKLRLNKHNSNKGAKATRGYKWLLIYSKKFNTKSGAMSYEYKLKKNFSLRKKIKENKFNNEKI